MLQNPLHLSVGGQIMFLTDESGSLSPITLTSKQLRRICRKYEESTISAGTMPMVDAVATSNYIIHILKEITGYKLKQAKVKTDNESLDDVAHATTAVEEKRFRVDIAAIREEIGFQNRNNVVMF